MSYNLWLPELLTDEELNLKRKYELLRKKVKKEHTMHAEAVRKLAEPLPESPVKLPPAHAKEHAKKLVLAGKISLSPKAKEEKTSFKRPERKLSSATLVTSPKKDDDVSAAEVGRAGIWSFTSMFNEAEGGIRAAQTNSTSIMNSFDFEEPNSLARVPKRGPSIYVYANGATLTEETLRSIFARFGKIVKIKITSPSVAFVVYAVDDCAERAINETHGAIYNGVEYQVNFAWRQPLPFMRSSIHNTSNTTCCPVPSSSGTGPSQLDSSSSSKNSWDYKRQPIVYEGDDDIEFTQT
ncbi:unnamed protein product [Orchesella dallaii]|uniref:Negative elongation factor E n=1 Tax=Orchesella dallaii TaxID=48710 RepID=A0ABP1RNW2_9HEXA